MMPTRRVLTPRSLAPLLGILSVAGTSIAQTKAPGLPSETPAKFEPKTDSFDYVKRDVMIAMRDGVKLHTVILVPRAPRARRSC